MVEGARLESVRAVTGPVGSNPTPSVFFVEKVAERRRRSLDSERTAKSLVGTGPSPVFVLCVFCLVGLVV